MAGPLNGIRIIDLTDKGPGARCAKTLADLGADVIRIVGGRAIPARWWLYGARRNTRAIGIDLKDEHGREAFLKLLARADVLMVGLRPSAAERLGITYEKVQNVNEGLIYCSITAFGVDGPYRDVAGHDINYQAIGGSLGMNRSAGKVVMPGATIADSAGGGMQAAIAILAAIIARQRTGRGQFVDVAATDGIVELMSVVIDDYLTTGIEPSPGETVLTGEYPWYNVYRTKDGKYVSVGAMEPWFYANLCRLLGREDFIPHQWTDGEKREEIRQAFGESFLTRTRDEWTKALMHADACVTPVNSIADVASDPQLVRREMIIEVDRQGSAKHRQVGFTSKFRDTPCRVDSIDPKVGEHTADILREVGYSIHEIGLLKERGIVT